MTIQISTVASSRLSSKTRRGMSSIEYVLICCLIVVFAVASIFVLGESANGLFRGVAGEFAMVDRTTAKTEITTSTELVDSIGANQIVTSDSAVLPRHLQWLVIVSTVFSSVLGIRYLYYARHRKAKIEAPESEFQYLARHSEALEKILSKRKSVHHSLTEDWVQLFDGKATIEPYMSTQVVTVRPTLSIGECSTLLAENGYRRVMVTHADGRMAGVVSKKDLLKNGTTVADVMTDNPRLAKPDTELRIALSILIQHRVSCLPVVEGERLVGLLSTSDLLVALQCILVILSTQTSEWPADNGELEKPVKMQRRSEPQLTS